MSFSRGGSSESATTNEQNPITATDNAMVASEGGTINVTDGGAFDVVRDALGSIGDSLFSHERLVNNVIASNESTVGNALLTNESVVNRALSGSEAIAQSAIDNGEALSLATMEKGLQYNEASNNLISDMLADVFSFVGDTVDSTQKTVASSASALFDSAKSDELNKSQDMQQTIRTIAMWGTVGLGVYAISKYAFK